MKKDQKILVAMSGGVDSSVAAALLKVRGYEVSGAFMRLFGQAQSDSSEKRAKKVARILGIPFFVFDLRKEFKKKVIDYFLKEYQRGRTPNPCVACNKEIKFGLFLDKAVSLKFNYVASGHYARKKGGKILIAKDKEKDQSYFLWKIHQKQLGRIIFPLGDLSKKKVRESAKTMGLPVLDVPESQEICFAGKEADVFLNRLLKPKPGIILNEKNEPIGRHKGTCLYTIGQRKGIGLSGGPYYVVKKDARKNILVVSRRNEDLMAKELIAERVSWISGREPRLPIVIRVKTRYRQKSFLATARRSGKKIKVVFNKPQRAITPGQSAVFYSGQELLGGGIIC